jgi:peptide/nickel transport system substrate-binding protein
MLAGTKSRLKILALVTLAVLLGSSSFGAIFGVPIRSHAVSGGTMALGTVNTPPLAAVNPFNGVSDFTLIGMLYDYMFSWNWPPLPAITGIMAGGWSMAPNGTSYALSLRPNLKWDNGSPLNATDLWYTMWMYNATGTFPEGLTSISIVNSTTVNFTLSAANPNFIVQGFIDTGFAVLPYQTFEPAVAGNITNVYSFTNLNTIVADGPFVMTSYTLNENPIPLTANQYYWNGPPKLSTVDYWYFSSQTAYYNAFESGEIQSVSPSGAYAEIEPLANLKGDSLVGPPYATPALTVSALLNDWRFPTNSTDFRRALAYGTNVSNINLELNGPYSNVSATNQDWLISSYNQQIGFSNGTGPTGYSYNPTTARTILSTTPGFKYSGGGTSGNLEYSNGTQVSLTIEYRTTEPYSQDVATLLDTQWSALGISVTTLSVPSSTLRSGALNPNGWQVIASGVLGPQTDNGVTPGPGILQDIGDYYVEVNGTHVDWNSTFYTVVQRLQTDTPNSTAFNDDAQEAVELYVQGVPEIPLFNTYNFLAINNNYYWGSASNYTGVYYPQSTTGLAYYDLALDTIYQLSSSSSTTTTSPVTTGTTPTTATTASPTTTSTSSTTSSSNNTLLYAGIAVVVIIIVAVAVVAMMRRRPAAASPPASAPPPTT